MNNSSNKISRAMYNGQTCVVHTDNTYMCTDSEKYYSCCVDCSSDDPNCSGGLQECLECSKKFHKDDDTLQNYNIYIIQDYTNTPCASQFYIKLATTFMSWNGCGNAVQLYGRDIHPENMQQFIHWIFRRPNPLISEYYISNTANLDNEIIVADPITKEWVTANFVSGDSNQIWIVKYFDTVGPDSNGNTYERYSIQNKGTGLYCSSIDNTKFHYLDYVTYKTIECSATSIGEKELFKIFVPRDIS